MSVKGRLRVYCDGCGAEGPVGDFDSAGAAPSACAAESANALGNKIEDGDWCDVQGTNGRVQHFCPRCVEHGRHVEAFALRTKR